MDDVTSDEESLCPTHGIVVGDRCRLCGARKTINAVSGNVIWMRNGRVVRAFQDDRDAWVRVALEHKIPKDQWPERFRS